MRGGYMDVFGLARMASTYSSRPERRYGPFVWSARARLSAATGLQGAVGFGIGC